MDLWAAAPAGLFVAAAGALSETLTNPGGIERRARVTAALGASDLDLLLADWVGELVYRFDAFGWLTSDADVRLARRGDRWVIDASLDGETRDPERHPLKVLVKAVTYHELRVEQTADGWRARLVLDI